MQRASAQSPAFYQMEENMRICNRLSVDHTAQISLNGQPDRIARLIQDRQLKDRRIWSLFVKQFRKAPDDENKSWKGEYWGKLMRGGCITWQYTHDKELYDVLKWTVRDMLTTQDAEGRISTYSKAAEFHGWDIWCRKYVLLGFLYFCEICQDSTLRGQILAAACRHADYICANIGDGKIDITATSHLWGGINSSSILEPMVKLYQWTGKAVYLEFADYIVRRGGSSNGNIFELAYRDELDPYQYPDIKAYELMSCFEGLLLYSQITGSEKWKNAACSFAERLRKSDITIIGCAGCKHELLDHSAITQTDPELTGIMQETCVTVTWMKLCAKLLLLTGDSVWADEIEKSAYNALYGSVNLYQNPENGGLPFDSYSPLRANKRARFIGGFQKMENGTFFYGCCAAIGAAGTGLFPNLHLLRAGNEIVLEFYTQGEIKFTLQNGHPVTIRTQTAYPYDGTIKLTVQTEETEAFALKLRVPGYCRWSEYWIDAEPVCRAEHKETYISLERTWNSCSSITLCLDLHPRVVYDPRPENVQSGKQFIAFCDGPIVLARDARINADVGMPVTFVPEAFRIEKSEDFGIESGGNYLVRTGRDEPSRMIDYSSAGATWNEASEMECWLPVQKT